MAWELTAVIAELMTSNRVLGYCSRSIAWRMRPKLKAGSGVPMAAELPSTKTRYVPAALAAGNDSSAARAAGAESTVSAVSTALPSASAHSMSSQMRTGMLRTFIGLPPLAADWTP